jgi:hypothetical protein
LPNVKAKLFSCLIAGQRRSRISILYKHSNHEMTNVGWFPTVSRKLNPKSSKWISKLSNPLEGHDYVFVINFHIVISLGPSSVYSHKQEDSYKIDKVSVS